MKRKTVCVKSATVPPLPYPSPSPNPSPSPSPNPDPYPNPNPNPNPRAPTLALAQTPTLTLPPTSAVQQCGSHEQAPSRTPSQNPVNNPIDNPINNPSTTPRSKISVAKMEKKIAYEQRTLGDTIDLSYVAREGGPAVHRRQRGAPRGVRAAAPVWLHARDLQRQ